MADKGQLTPVPGETQLATGLLVNVESVLSNFDRNRFSNKDDGDNSSVAGLVGLRYKKPAGKVEADASAEIVPDGFPQIARLDAIEDQYLWQRETAVNSGRKRIMGGLILRPSNQFSGKVSTGFSDEETGLTARRLNFETEIKGVKHSQLRMKVNLASSEERGNSRTLLDLRPELQTDFLPVRVVVRGEYDQRGLESDSSQRTNSKREIE